MPAGHLIHELGAGVVKSGEEVVSLPTHTASNPYTEKAFTVELHHQRFDHAGPGENVSLNLEGLDKNNIARSGGEMYHPRIGQPGDTVALDIKRLDKIIRLDLEMKRVINDSTRLAKVTMSRWT